MDVSRHRTILLVDDDDVSLQALGLCLEALSPSPWILQAHNGKEAIEQLAEHLVDLVITDLHMPVMDGFAFLARLANHRPRIPAVVVTAFANPEVGNLLRRHGIHRVVSKPFDFAAMQKMVAHLLDGARGAISGFSLPAVLQLIELERKSCSVRLTKNILDSDVEGALYFEDGRLMDAATQDHLGDEAVRELLGWFEPLIEIDKPALMAEARVKAPISEFLAELARAEHPELALAELSATGQAARETHYAKVLESLRGMAGAKAVALFTWPDIALVAAAANEKEERLEILTRSAAEAFAIHARLAAAYGSNGLESMFWLERRFLLLHAIGPELCAMVAADPELTTAQLLRQQLRALLPPRAAG